MKPWIPLVLSALVSLSGCGRETSEETEVLRWEALPDLPDPVGVAGPYAGAHGEAIVVAGGANFAPPVWESSKVWHDTIRVLDGGAWRDAGRLPRPLAYGASVSLEAGVLCIGGNDATRTYDDVFLLRVTPAGVDVETWPSLPEPRAHHTATLLGDAVYVTSGQTGNGLETATSDLLRLDLTRRGRGDFDWERLAPCPGPTRSLAVAAAQGDGRTPHLYLMSGRRLEASGGFQLLRDTWAYDPARDSWRRRRDAPRCVMAGVAAPAGAAHVAVVSGDDGSLFGRADELRDEHPGFFRTALLYHPITDTWTEGGALPSNQVTTQAVPWRGGFVVASGEVRPRVRSPKLWHVTVHPPRVALHGLDFAAIGVYLAALVAMGVWFSRRERTTEDFFLGGRRIPWWAAGVSLFGTQLSAITFMAIPAHVFATDWVYFLGSMMIVACAPLVVFFYLPFFRGLEVTTAYEYLERRFHVAVRLLGSAAFILFQLGRMGIVLYLPALALATVTGLDVYLCIALMGLLATIYTVLGGIEAVIWTDVVQVVVLLGGALISLGVILLGTDDVLGAARESGKLHMVDLTWDAATTALWVVVLGKLLENLIPYTSDQTVVQRYLTTADERKAAAAVWTNAALTVPATLLFFGIGTALWAWYREHPEALTPAGRAGDVFPWFIATELPVGVAGLVIAGLFAASMSSLDSSMNSIATALTTDFYRRFKPGVDDAHCLRLARWLTVLLGAVGTGFALYMAALESTSMWDTYSKVIGLFGSGLAGLFFAGVFTRRTSTAGILIGFAASTAVLFLVRQEAAETIHFFLYPAIGIMTCVGVAWLVSFALPQKESTTGLTVHSRS